MWPQRIVRTLAAGALVGAGWALARAARRVRQAADVVKPEPDADLPEGPAGPVTAGRAEPLATAEDVPRVETPPSVAVPTEGLSRARTPETHIDGLAAKPASEVIDAVDRLSTEELGQLYEHEQTHKRRKTVLQAIEKALAPTG